VIHVQGARKGMTEGDRQVDEGRKGMTKATVRSTKVWAR
jgi:hypothetical protein